MATQNVSGRIQTRRDTASNWATENPTLLAGELAFETDTKKRKIGDGSTAYNSLPYIGVPVSACTAGNYYAVNTEISLTVSLANYSKLHFVCGDDSATEGVQTITVMLDDSRTYHKLAWNTAVSTEYATVLSLAKSNKALIITINKTTNKVTITATNVTDYGIRNIFAE